MSATILDGKALAATIKENLSARVSQLKSTGVTPGLGTVLVGDDPGSISYVAGKHRDCEQVGINSIRVDLRASATESDVLAAIKELNSAKECTGYIVQLPMPNGINAQAILEAIDPAKDADGLHPIAIQVEHQRGGGHNQCEGVRCAEHLSAIFDLRGAVHRLHRRVRQVGRAVIGLHRFAGSLQCGGCVASFKVGMGLVAVQCIQEALLNAVT